MSNKRLSTIGLLALAALGAAGQADAQAGGAALAARFHRLDTNRDGVLSRNEAAADPKIRALYGSLDTSANIENPAANIKPGGITLDQFVAGMQAAQNGGAVGPAASGGETYKVYRNGSAERVPGTGVGANANRMNR